MATRRISLNVGELWRTTLVLKNDISWFHLKCRIEEKTGIAPEHQQLTPNARDGDKCLLEDGDEIICKSKLNNGDHPLHYASAFGNIEAIHSWIASGADINITNINGLTPLLLACENIQEKAVKELIQLGANVHNVEVNGLTALHVSVLHWQISIEIKNIVKLLIVAGCDPMARNNKGETIFDLYKTHETISAEIKKVVEEIIQENLINK